MQTFREFVRLREAGLMSLKPPAGGVGLYCQLMDDPTGITKRERVLIATVVSKVMPMLAAFRANVDWDLERGKFGWKLPLEQVLAGTIEDMARI